MNFFLLPLSATPSVFNYFQNEIIFTDTTSVTLSTFSLPFHENLVPLSLKINWGDNSQIESYQANFYSLTSRIISATKPDIFLQNYNHTYNTSISTLTRILTCQVVVSYIDNRQYYFNIPIRIISPSFFKKVGDIYLQKSSILTNGNNFYVFSVQEDGAIVETVLDKSSI